MKTGTATALVVGACIAVALAWKALGPDGVDATGVGARDTSTPAPEETLPGTAAPVTAVSTPGAGVVARGTVKAEGRGFEGARVSAVRVDGARGTLIELGSEALSKRDGAFELRDLPEPPFRLRAEAKGWRPAWAEIGPAGESRTVEGVELELAPAGSIAGRVTLGGTPIANVQLFAGDEGSNDLGRSLEAQASSGTDGRYELTPVRPGRMTIAAFAPHAGFGAAVTDVRQGSTATTDIALTPLGRANGRVVDEAGKPVAGASVVAMDPGTHDLLPEPMPEGASTRLLTIAGRMQSTLTDADGRFEFRTLMSRTVKLAVRVPGYAQANATVTDGGAPVEMRLKLEPSPD